MEHKKFTNNRFQNIKLNENAPPKWPIKLIQLLRMILLIQQ